MKIVFSFFVCFFLAFSGCTQPKATYSVKDKKAIKSYEEALVFYNNREMRATLDALQKVVSETPSFMEAQFMLAQVHDEMGNTHEAIVPLTEALRTNPNFFPEGWLMLAECYFAEGNYAEAEKAVSTFMPFPKNDIQLERRAQIILSSCVYAKDAIAHPVPFEPKNLGPEINTTADEYYPCITADENTLLFTRLVSDERAWQGKQEDFFIATKSGDKWSTAAPVLSINTVQNEGAPTLSADGLTLIFTACETADGMWGGERQGVGSCDLFFSMKNGSGWTPAKNIGQGINTGSWESQPSYSTDGRTLYFVRGKRSARGIREQDIYFSYLNADGRWSAPEKVPGKINTSFEEESVMIHPDGNTLYFSSNGHPGMGGLDVYMSRRQPDGSWGTPINLGYPINTYANENSLQVTANGQIALFASERPGGKGGLDLYAFELHEKARPNQVTYVQGVISDKLSYKKLEAHFELIDLTTGKVVIESYSNQGNGEFLICLPTGKDYALNVSKNGYLFHSENFSLKDYNRKEPYRLDIALQKLRPGASIVLNNVFFTTNRFDLLPESKIELNRLAELLKANPTIKIEISGHTDDVGAEEANLLLSQNRAAAVVTYLVGQNVVADRLQAKGYGETKPIADNSTEQGRARNRRTEFIILE